MYISSTAYSVLPKSTLPLHSIKSKEAVLFKKYHQSKTDNKVLYTNSLFEKKSRYYTEKQHLSTDIHLIGGKLHQEIQRAIPIYEDFLKLSDIKKIELIIDKIVDRVFIAIDRSGYCKNNLSDKWQLLQMITQNQAKLSPGFPVLSDFNLDKILKGIDLTSLPLLLSLSSVIVRYQKNVILRNATEVSWSTDHTTFPFTGDYKNHESSMALEEFILPSLTNGMVVREMGCWNGELLIRLALTASSRNIYPAGLFGADLNEMALKSGIGLLHHLNLADSITLGLGNAIDQSFFTSFLPEAQQMILAFRLIPTLDEESIDLFFSTLQKNTKNKDLVCLSYALPSGNDYSQVLEKVANGRLKRPKEQKSEEVFTYYDQDEIFQTYTTTKYYEPILKKYQFQQINVRKFLSNGPDRMISFLQNIS